jgi:hypothetical protein
MRPDILVPRAPCGQSRKPHYPGRNERLQNDSSPPVRTWQSDFSVLACMEVTGILPVLLGNGRSSIRTSPMMKSGLQAPPILGNPDLAERWPVALAGMWPVAKTGRRTKTSALAPTEVISCCAERSQFFSRQAKPLGKMGNSPNEAMDPVRRGTKPLVRWAIPRTNPTAPPEAQRLHGRVSPNEANPGHRAVSPNEASVGLGKVGGRGASRRAFPRGSVGTRDFAPNEATWQAG